MVAGLPDGRSASFLSAVIRTRPRGGPMTTFWRRFSPQYFLFFFVCLVFSTNNSNAIAEQLTMTWIDESSNEDGFTIERENGTTGTFSQIAAVGANVTSYA